MRKTIPILFLSVFATLCGCTMFSAWRAVPPPGGCDQCHTLPISNDWQVAYKVPILTNERSKTESFQTEQSIARGTAKPSSSLDLRKMEELQCFECHKSPNAAHKGRKGRFHH
jgi:hypothetical protein